MTFLLPTEHVDAADRPGLATSEEGAQASGTPFRSFYTPQEMLSLAREAGFKDARHVSGASHAERYFAGRTDGLRPSSGETCWSPAPESTEPHPHRAPGRGGAVRGRCRESGQFPYS